MAYSAESIYGVQLLDDLHNYFPELLYNSGRFQSVQEVLQYITSVTRRRFDLFSYGREVYSANLANAQRTAGSVPMDVEQPTATGQVPMQNATITPRVPHVPIFMQHASVPIATAPTAQQPTPQPTVQITPQNAPPPYPPQEPIATSPSLLQPIVPTRPSRRTYASLFTHSLPQQPLSHVPPQQSMTSLESLLQLLQPPAPPPIITTTYTTSDDEATSWLMSLLSGGRGGLPASFLEPVPVFPTREQVQGGSTVRILDVSDGTNTCTICQDDMSVGNTIRTLNTCQHTFHISCIDTWLVSNVRCPVCRHDIRETGNATDGKVGEEDADQFGDEDEI